MLGIAFQCSARYVVIRQYRSVTTPSLEDLPAINQVTKQLDFLLVRPFATSDSEKANLAVAALSSCACHGGRDRRLPSANSLGRCRANRLVNPTERLDVFTDERGYGHHSALRSQFLKNRRLQTAVAPNFGKTDRWADCVSREHPPLHLIAMNRTGIVGGPIR